MLNLNQLYQEFMAMTSCHAQLAMKFRGFADSVKMQVESPALQFKGISASLYLERGYFTITYFGRTLQFDFSSALSEDGTLVGIVMCHLVSESLEKAPVTVGEFTFARNGKANIINPDSGQSIFIDEDVSALHVALHFMHEGLSK